MKVLWNHDHEVVLIHVVHRMVIYDVLIWKWGIFSIEKQLCFKSYQLLALAPWESIALLPVSHSSFLLLGSGQRLQSWVWVRTPSPIISLKQGFSNLTPIYFFKNMLSVGCLLHITSSLNINRTYYLYYFKISKKTRPALSFFQLLHHFGKHLVCSRAIL